MLPIVVTTGQRFIDLDALASVVAYCEIDPTKYLPIIPGPLNHSVTLTVKKWGFSYDVKPPKNVEGYIVMDVSEDKFIAEFVDINKVVEIYDHHSGYENIWAARTWVKSEIVEIGACATLVWEEIKRRKIEDRSKKLDGEIGSANIDRSIRLQSPTSPPSFPPPPSHFISPTAANLLYTAIVTHTLSFKISITNERDRKAAEELKPYCNLPDQWIAQYFREIEADVYRDPVFAIANDTKLASLRGQTVAIGQVEMWLPEFFIKENRGLIKSALRQFETELWLYISPCISKGISYLVTDNQAVKEWLRMHLGATFDRNSDVGFVPHLILRKDILRKLERN